MNNELFVIAAGGTGSKVAEALVHLCAVGLGPQRLHILLVDGDAANGNRTRTEECAEAYGRLQRWPWVVQPLCSKDLEVKFFATQIKLYRLADTFDGSTEGGIRPRIAQDKDLLQVLEVLLGNTELTRDLSEGFAGCPNLGSLVMDNHLRRKFEEEGDGNRFIKQLVESSSPVDSYPSVVVVGSVFGGTGASLLPVVQRCVRSYFEKKDKNGATREDLFARIRWAKIMQLPYFRPQDGPGMKLNNTNRHLLDCSCALWFYGQQVERKNGPQVQPLVYLIGSELPGRRLVPGNDGGADQTNPAFYHEILAGLSVLDAWRNPEVRDDRPIRHLYNVNRNECCDFTNLPQPFGWSRDNFLRHFCSILHLAAFSIMHRKAPASAYEKGLFQFVGQHKLTGWNSPADQTVRLGSLETREKGKSGNDSLQYFGRLLLWATTCLSRSPYESEGIEFSSSGSYRTLHHTMSFIEADEVSTVLSTTETDNPFAHICRVALCAILSEALCDSHPPLDKNIQNIRGHRYKPVLPSLVAGKYVSLPVTDLQSILTSLVAAGMDDNEAKKLAEAYTGRRTDQL